MKDKKVNLFNKIIVSIMIIVMIFIVIFLIKIKQNNSDIVLNSNQKYDVDYKIFLRENEHYQEKYLEKGKGYIASIIDYINADFKYEYNSNDVNNIDYTYRIDAKILIKDKENTIYDKTYNLVSTKKGTSNNNFSISENLDIDFNKYNDVTRSLLNEYGIQNSSSMLNVIMTINTSNGLDDTVLMEIPLDTKIVAINLSNNPKTSDKIIEAREPNKLNNMYIFYGLLLESLLIIILVYRLIVYENNNVEYIYNNKINKILSKYGSYIQKVWFSFDVSNYKILRVKNFKNLLDIMDIVNSPILMVENSRKDERFFLILTNDNLIYAYVIKKDEIEKNLIKKRLYVK